MRMAYDNEIGMINDAQVFTLKIVPATYTCHAPDCSRSGWTFEMKSNMGR